VQHVSRLPFNLASRFPMQILIAEDNLIDQQVALQVLQRLGLYGRHGGER
jgi:hypothetical protein